MKIERSERAGVRSVDVDGEVDMDSSPTLWAELQKDLATRRPLRVRLASVRYIDSSGIAILVQAHKQAHRGGVDFALESPSSQVLAVLQLAQLAKLFRIEDAPLR